MAPVASATVAEQRVAVVTGAARGIGAATVRRLAADGWAVVAVDACADDPAVPYPLGTRAELDAVCAPHGDALPFVADVRDALDLAAAVALAVERFGGLDAAVGAAAVIAGGHDAWETDDDTWRVLLDVDLLGVLNLARAAVPALLARPEPRTGRFVALASAASHHGLWRLSAYNAVKHAVAGFVLGLAADLRGSGVTATAVSPGSTRTPMLRATADLYGMDDPEGFAVHQLVERLLEPAEVAATVAWLCAAESGALTGTVVRADGGFTG